MSDRSLLLVGDPHACPGYDNERFSALGNYVRETRPTTVLVTGDGPDAPSLGRFDRGKVNFEGRRYRKDVDVTHDALDRFKTELRGLRYRPRLVYLKGNHDHRADIWAAEHPEMAESISSDDFGFADYGWEVVPFREITQVEGFNACHYIEQPNSSREIGGVNVAKTLLAKCHESVIVGHCHLLDVASTVTVSGKAIHAISPGCFTHPRFVEDWSKQSARMHWRGVVRLDGVNRGDYQSMTQVSLAQLMRAYGGSK